MRYFLGFISDFIVFVCPLEAPYGSVTMFMHGTPHGVYLVWLSQSSDKVLQIKILFLLRWTEVNGLSKWHKKFAERTQHLCRMHQPTHYIQLQCNIVFMEDSGLEDTKTSLNNLRIIIIIIIYVCLLLKQSGIFSCGMRSKKNYGPQSFQPLCPIYCFSMLDVLCWSNQTWYISMYILHQEVFKRKECTYLHCVLINSIYIYCIRIHTYLHLYLITSFLPCEYYCGTCILLCMILYLFSFMINTNHKVPVRLKHTCTCILAFWYAHPWLLQCTCMCYICVFSKLKQY